MAQRAHAHERLNRRMHSSYLPKRFRYYNGINYKRKISTFREPPICTWKTIHRCFIHCSTCGLTHKHYENKIDAVGNIKYIATLLPYGIARRSHCLVTEDGGETFNHYGCKKITWRRSTGSVIQFSLTGMNVMQTFRPTEKILTQAYFAGH